MIGEGGFGGFADLGEVMRGCATEDIVFNDGIGCGGGEPLECGFIGDCAVGIHDGT